MSETLELQQVICPSCKQVITSFSPFQAEVECPYCHNKAFNPLITAKKVPIPERLIIFRTSEKDFEKSMIDNLVDHDYVPTDIFQYINPGNVIKAYLPMFLYEGTYQSSWSCEMAIETTEVRASFSGNSLNNEKVKKFIPQTGTSQGNFAFLCLAYEGNDIPNELKAFSQQYKYNVMASKEYDPALLGLESGERPLTLALDTETDLTWNKYGDALVNDIATQNAQKQLSGNEIQNFRASNSYHLKHNGRYVLAPFWFVYYTYNNTKHYFIMDGLGEGTSMTTPIDQEEVKFVKGRNLIKSIYKYLWIPTWFVFCWLDLIYALIYLMIWFISKIILNYLMDKQIKDRLNASREARRLAAQNLG